MLIFVTSKLQENQVKILMTLKLRFILFNKENCILLYKTRNKDSFSYRLQGRDVLMVKITLDGFRVSDNFMSHWSYFEQVIFEFIMIDS